jgi:hypothetical protein
MVVFKIKVLWQDNCIYILKEYIMNIKIISDSIQKNKRDIGVSMAIWIMFFFMIVSNQLKAMNKDTKDPLSANGFKPGEIILKFKDNSLIGEVADQLITARKEFKTIENCTNLDELNNRYGLKSITRLLTDSESRNVTVSSLTPDVAQQLRQSKQDAFFKRMEKIKADNGQKGEVNSKNGFKYLGNLYKLSFDKDVNVEAVCAEYQQDPTVEFAHPNYTAKLCGWTNDPYLRSKGSWGQTGDDLWALKKINCPQAWDFAEGTGVIVAVIDSGIDPSHPDISANIVPGWNFVENNNNPIDLFGHGTHVSGTIAAIGNNATGIVGVAPKAKIMPLKVFNDEGGNFIEWNIEAIDYAVLHGARIINNSWETKAKSIPALEAVIHNAYLAGCVVVFAAGNDSTDVKLSSPVNMGQPIVVGASTPSDQKAGFSRFGENLDVVAPGSGEETGSEIYPIGAILSLKSTVTNYDIDFGGDLVVDNHYLRQAGTSMAAPHVTGLAALILQQHPNYTPEQVRQVLRLSSDDILTPGFDSDSGYGRINALKAMKINEPMAVNIINPMRSSFLHSEIIEIQGVSSGRNFKKWTLTFEGIANGQPLTVLASGTTPVNFGTLIAWNIADIPNGQYRLCLSTENTSGSQYVDYKYIWIYSLSKAPHAVSEDYNNNGMSDLLWCNDVTGQVYEMPMNGSTVLPGAIINTFSNQDWNLIGKGDLDGDGKTDLLWQQTNTNYIFEMFMDGTTVKSTYLWTLYGGEDRDMQPICLSSFWGDNGSGAKILKTILWRNHESGYMCKTKVDGITFYKHVSVAMDGNYYLPNLDMQIVASEDFDKNGFDDLLFWNCITGEVSLALMETINIVSSVSVIYTEPNTDWNIVSNGDFNGDSSVDLLWRNKTTGQVYVQLLNDGVVSGGAVIYTEPNPDWQIVSTGDFNGDNKADIVWRNRITGQVYQMLMNGTAIQSQAIIYIEPNTAWKIL